METTWAAHIEHWNQMIRSGRGAEIAREITKVPRGKLPIDQLAKIANVCWRIGHPSMGLRLLSPELRRLSQRNQDAPPEALAEYASCLQEIGAAGEAKTILRATQQSVPRAKFYLALLLLKEWNYPEALPLLESYLSQIPNDYHSLVVRVNLAATYVMNSDFKKATETIRTLQSELEQFGHKLLLGNCHEIESQIHYNLGNHRQALHCLEKSERLLGGSNNVSWIYCKKWQFINRIYSSTRAPDTSALEKEQEELRAQAQKMSNWETLRDLDLHWALFTKNQDLLNQVYFGTPAREYRRRLVRSAAKIGLELPQTTMIEIATDRRPKKHHHYDLRPEVFCKDEEATFLLKKLLLILASDFYAPFRIGQIFSQLFTSEYYNIETSPARVSQLIHRLRNWLLEENWQAKIQAMPTGYALHFQPGSLVQMDENLPGDIMRDKQSTNLALLQREFGARVFSATELCTVLQCSKRSVNRVLRELEADSQIQRIGSGRSTRFQIAS